MLWMPMDTDVAAMLISLWPDVSYDYVRKNKSMFMTYAGQAETLSAYRTPTGPSVTLNVQTVNLTINGMVSYLRYTTRRILGVMRLLVCYQRRHLKIMGPQIFSLVTNLTANLPFCH